MPAGVQQSPEVETLNQRMQLLELGQQQQDLRWANLRAQQPGVLLPTLPACQCSVTTITMFSFQPPASVAA